jgi:hypothetical protein
MGISGSHQMMIDTIMTSSLNNSRGGVMSKEEKITHLVYFTLHAFTIALLLIK